MKKYERILMMTAILFSVLLNSTYSEIVSAENLEIILRLIITYAKVFKFKFGFV